ncbi:MAG: rubredoxin [Methanolinea sp.]|jgi:rubredoxin|nr:rubredoxin [Methanolinea sp.]
MDSYMCTICGHIYNPDRGEPDMGIPPGIDFSQLPGDWKCPVCKAAPGLFRRL